MEELLEAVERILQHKPLSSIQWFVLHQSLLGKTYGAMAKVSGYRIDYIKEVGSQLWQDLSEALGERVTKKNLHIVLSKKLQDNTHLSPKEYPIIERNLENEFPDLAFLTSKIDFSSGPIPPDSPFYINRPPLEEIVYNEIMQPGCLLRIKAPKKMGKSSLLNRIIAHAKKQGCQIVYLDFQEADEDVFNSLDRFLRWFCINVSRQLNLFPCLDDFWDAQMGSKVSCKIYFEGYLLRYIDSKPVVLALNEVDRLFEYSHIAQDFLLMLQLWHEAAKQEQIWQKLRIVIVHTTEIYIPLKPNQSTFNVGVTVSIPPFTLEQVQNLARCYGIDGIWDRKGAQQLACLQAMIGGHPYLANLALYHLRQGKITLETLLKTAHTATGIYSQHLKQLLSCLQAEPQLLAAMQQIVTAHQKVQLEAIVAYKLESMGLVKLDGERTRISCELYRLYFQEQLGKQHPVNSSQKLLGKQQKEYSLTS